MMEATLQRFFAAVNSNNVDEALACCAQDTQCSYPDPGRNWQGHDRARTVMTAIFGQLQRANRQAVFDIVRIDQVQRSESWGHPTIQTKTVYTFTADNDKIPGSSVMENLSRDCRCTHKAWAPLLLPTTYQRET